MSNKVVMKHYLGVVFGLTVGLTLIILSFLKVIDLLEGIYLFFISIPFVVWVKLHGLTFLKNDFFSMVVFILLTLVYSSLIGQLIFLLRVKPRAVKYWIFMLLLIVFSVIAYQHSAVVLNSLEEGIGKIF